MKVKKFKIIIASSQKAATDGFFERFEEAWKLAKKRKLPASEHDLILTLPNLLERTPTNVQRDVHELAELGIVELKKTRRKGQKRESL